MARLAHDWFAGDLPGNVSISCRSWLHSKYAFRHYHSILKKGLRIGCHSGIHEGRFFDLGPAESIRIGDYTTIVGAIIRSGGPVEIGEYCLIAHEVVLSDNRFGIPGVPAAQKGRINEKRSITVGRNCWIATGAILLGRARVGDDCIVGAHTVVDFEIPAGKLVVGNPPKILDLPQLRKSTATSGKNTVQGP
jgi:acetyltransferase-like isoleucine patch superfamily enzyme